MSVRIPVVVTGFALTAVLTASPQIALAEHSQQVPSQQSAKKNPAAVRPVAEEGAAKQVVAERAVEKKPLQAGALKQAAKYERAVKVMAPKKAQVKKSAIKNKAIRAIRPLASYRKTAGFNDHSRIHPHGHEGLDMAARSGTTVRAAMSGRVTFAGWDGGYGRKIVISHGNGVTTVYGHLSRIRVVVGQRVLTGARIGNVGTSGRTTGPHLHFEVRKFGKPTNPTTFMRTQGIRL